MKELTPDERKILVDAIQDSATVVHKGQKGMNERIKQLADEAAKYSAVMALPTGQSGNELFVAKLAELIVQECYEHCKGHILPKGMAEENDLNYNDGVMDCAIGLKQHFGVEE